MLGILNVSRTRFLLAAAVMALSACAENQWARSDTTVAQTDEDEKRCEDDAQYLAWRAVPLTPATTVVHRNGVAVFAGRGPYIEERRLAYFCMIRKGYKLVPVERPD
jgi:hypothetical protein